MSKLIPVQDHSMLEEIFKRMHLPKKWKAYSPEGNGAMLVSTGEPDEWIEFNIGFTKYVIRLYEEVE